MIDRLIVDVPDLKGLKRDSKYFLMTNTPYMREMLLTTASFLRVRFKHNSRFVEFEYEGSEDIGTGIKIYLGDYITKH